MDRRSDANRLFQEQNLLYQKMLEEPLKYFYSDLQERIVNTEVVDYPDLQSILEKLDIEEAADNAFGCIKMTSGLKLNLDAKATTGWLEQGYKFVSVFLYHLLYNEAKFEKDINSSLDTAGDKLFVIRAAEHYFNNTKFSEIALLVKSIYDLRNKGTHQRVKCKKTGFFIRDYKKFTVTDQYKIFKNLNKLFNIIDQIFKKKIKLLDKGEGFIKKFKPELGNTYDVTVKEILELGLKIEIHNKIDFIHISELSWGRIENITNDFNIGDVLKVKRINKKNKDFDFYSRKVLLPNPNNT